MNKDDHAPFQVEPPKDWGRLLMSFIGALLTIIMAFIAYQSQGWNANIASLAQNVAELNTRMATVVESLSHTRNDANRIEKRVDEMGIIVVDHEARIRVLERRR